MKVAKKLLVGVSLVSAVGLLAACGNSSKSSNGGKTKEIEFFSQKKEMQPTLQKIIKDFEKENPDIKVKFTNVPDAGKVLKTRIASGDTPDVVNVYPQNADFQEWAKAGVFEDLTGKDYLKNLKEGAAETYAINDKIYSIPLTNNAWGFFYNADKFKELVSKNGKIRKWYEVLKEGTESVIDRIFITGVAPITLDSLTSGFNICSDKTRDRNFNEMLGFTKEELEELMKSQNIAKEEQENLLPIMKENYDGYIFALKAKEKMYNSNMCLYFLNEYTTYKEIPDQLVDVNIASDYSKIGKMLNLCKGENREEIIKKTVSGEGILTEIVEKFNPSMEFGETELVSMLFYLGYLTITGEKLGRAELKIPNNVMKEIYSDYFLKMIDQQAQMTIELKEYNEILEEMALEGRIDKIVEMLEKYLKNLSNRDFQRFDEKYVKLIFYSIAMNLKIYSVKSELEVEREYPDILLIPRDRSKGYNAIMIEFKYLKKGEEKQLEKSQREAREQIEKYSNKQEMKDIEKMNKYTIVVVNDKTYVEKID